MPDSIYADVAVVRIQSWLARTPRLRGRRGASALLSQATSAAVISGLLPDGVELNPEAGDVDGVVSLRSPVLPDAAPEGAEEAARAAAAEVARHLRDRLPAAELELRSPSHAPDYLTAYASRPPVERWQPAVSEIAWALPCASCGMAPATERRDLRQEERDASVCRDCAHRLDAAGRSTSRRPDDQPRAEQIVRGLLPPELQGKDFPDDFGAIAALDDSTHLATVHIDGNRVGALFDALVRDKGRSGKAELARGIDGATATALGAALTEISKAEDGCLPIAVHVMGGDDLLVTVPAGRALAFCQRFLRSFQERIGGWLAGSGLNVKVAPSASAGLVWHHAKHPFALAVDQAEQALSDAKSAVLGCEASIAWADVTADGADASAVRGPRTLRWLDDNSGALAGVRALPASQRTRLLRLPERDLPEQLRRRGLDDARTLYEQGHEALLDALRLARWAQ